MDDLNKYIVSNFKKNFSYSEPFLEIKKNFLYSKYSYLEVWDLITRTISFFRANKLQPGDKLLIWGANSPEWAVLFLAAILEGVIIIPASILLSASVIEKYIRQLNPKIIFTSMMLPELHKKDHAQIYYIEYLFDLARQQQQAEISSKPRLQDTLEVVFTSGTTGDPKGVIITRQNMYAQISYLAKLISIKDGSRTISLLPYSHVYEQLINLLFALQFTGTIYYLLYLTPVYLQKSFKEFKPTHLILVPQLLKIVTDKIYYKIRESGFSGLISLYFKLGQILPFNLKRKFYLPINSIFGGKLEMITLGGAKTDVHIQRQYLNWGIKVIEGYGLTETTGMISMETPDYIRLGTSGKPVAGIELKFSPDQEILVKGKMVFPGYYNKPQETAAMFTADGFLKTGDMGELNSNGDLVLKGRQKFRIVLENGEKVYPEDIEFQAKQISGVKDICVFAYNIGNRQEVAAAIIAEADKKNAKLADLLDQINAALEISQRITHAFYWPDDELPKTSTYKIDRKLVAETAAKHLHVKSSQVKHSGFNWRNAYPDKLDKDLQLKKILSLVCRVEVSDIESGSVLKTDLGVDSLRRLSIISLIEEEFSKRIAEDSIKDKTNFSDLIKLVKNAPRVKQLKDKTGWQFSAWAMGLRKFLFFLFMPLFRIFVKIKTTGAENIISAQGAIYMSNHPGMFDMFFLLDILSKKGVKVFALADSDYWIGLRRIVIAPFLELFGAIPINKSGENEGPAMAQLGQLLKKDFSLLIVPQGTPTYNDPDKIKDIKDGIINITDLADYPIVPCVIDPHYNDIFDPRRKTVTNFINGENLLPRNLKDKNVQIIFGQSFYLDASKSMAEKKEILIKKFMDLLAKC